MKILILCAISFLCAACADLQFPRFNDATSVDSNQSTPPVAKSNNSKSANKNTKTKSIQKQNNVSASNATNQTNSGQSIAKSSKPELASAPDVFSKMHQDMKREDAKPPKEKSEFIKRHESSDKLKGESESVYRCPTSYTMLTIFFTSNGIQFRDSFQKDVTKSIFNVKTKDNIVYFEQSVESDFLTTKYKFALDTVNNKLVELQTATNKVSEQKQSVSYENVCKKLK